MLKHFMFVVLFFLSLTSTTLRAQGICSQSQASNKLICLIPNIYGASGLELDANGHQGHFAQSIDNTAVALNDAVGIQSATLPFASPSSGLTFTWDPLTKTFASSTDSLGPILGERAETIGRYRLSVGMGYQYFGFDKLDGVRLNNLPAVFTHQDDFIDGDATSASPCTITAPNGSPQNTLGCGYVRDVVATNSRINLKIHQFTTFITFGLTNRIDLSAAIPIENVRMGVSSDATIVSNSNSGDHQFLTRADCPFPCLTSSFSGSRNVSGIGDITLRVKATAWKGERAAVALGMDIRVPSGDEQNFLGAGAVGVRPFAVWSYRARVSPHVVVGYQTNGKTLLGGDVSNGVKDKLPSEFTYSAGADVRLAKWITAAFDLTGQQVFEVHRVSLNPDFHDLGPCLPLGLSPGDPGYCTDAGIPNKYSTLTQFTGSFNISNASVGIRIKPIAGLLITGNALIRLNDGGLHTSTATPLVGISYTF